MIFRNLLLFLQCIIFKGKTLIILSTLFPTLSIRALYIQMPAVPLLEPPTVQKDLLLSRFLLSECDGRRHLAR